jgi:hypothetical protein
MNVSKQTFSREENMVPIYIVSNIKTSKGIQVTTKDVEVHFG